MERRQILLGRRGNYLQEDGEINALFSGIQGAQTPLGVLWEGSKGCGRLHVCIQKMWKVF